MDDDSVKAIEATAAHIVVCRDGIWKLNNKATQLERLMEFEAPSFHHDSGAQVDELRRGAQALAGIMDKAFNEFKRLLHKAGLPPLDQSPHCDQFVLHAPGECDYCDQCPAQQHWRVAAGVNFTGQSDEGKMRCPAEMLRSRNVIQRWAGNRVREVRR